MYTLAAVAFAYAVEINGVMHVIPPCDAAHSTNCVFRNSEQSFVNINGNVYDIVFGDYDEIISITPR